jgi:competence protein ComEC
MKFIFIAAFVFIITSAFDLQKELSKVGSNFQKICNEMLPIHTTESETLNSLVCGEKVTDDFHIKTLQRTGLIHVFVVSGGHLVVISELLGILNWPTFLRFFALLFFTFMTGFQPPCLRSLIQFFLAGKFLLKSDQKVFLSGIILLGAFPALVSSLSLQLSWVAALALSFCEGFLAKSTKPKKLILGSVFVYFATFPLLQSLSGPHPLSILWNILFAPAMSLFLFPLSALAFVSFHALSFVEFLMPWLWKVLAMAEEVSNGVTLFTWNPVLSWIWILALHGFVHLFLVAYRRKAVS